MSPLRGISSLGGTREAVPLGNLTPQGLGLKTAQSANPAFKRCRYGERPKPLAPFPLDPFNKELAALHQ